MKDSLIPYVLLDKDNNPYLTFNASDLTFKPAIPKNATDQPYNYTSFLSESLTVVPKATDIFSSDLTSRDDLILAILSLILILLIDAILTTILLRTYHGQVSTFAFSVKQFVELARDFHLTALFPFRRSSAKHDVTKKPQKKEKRRPNYTLLKVAALTLTCTFGLEVLVLYLTTPDLVTVTNSKASFTVVENLIPDWNEIRANVDTAADQPCTTLTIEPYSSTAQLNQGITRIAPCLSATVGLNPSEKFPIVDDPVDVLIISNTHEFGAEHHITIGSESAHYRAMVYFSLQDKRRKIMRKRSQYFTRQDSVFYVHMQYIAYLFNQYVDETGDDRMNLERLASLKFNTNVTKGPEIKIAQINNQQRFREATSTSHTTELRGVIPRGAPALRFAIAFLKGSTGVSLTGPDLNDMDIGSSSTWATERGMWQEESRQLNWLTLTLVVLSAFCLFAILRYLLKPIGISEMAGEFVSRRINADVGRPIAYMGGDEKHNFTLTIHGDTSSTPGLQSESSTSLGDQISFLSEQSDVEYSGSNVQK